MELWVKECQHIHGIMKKLLILFLCCFSIATAAEEAAAQAHLAEDLFKLKDFARARDMYQSMLQESMPAWKRAVIMYNLGCALIGNKEWEQALQAFDAVAIDNSLKPILRYRIARNRLLVKILQAEDLSASNSQKAIELLQHVIEEAPLAQQAYCMLEQAEGEICSQSDDVEMLRAIALHDRSSLIKKSSKQRIEHVQQAEGLDLLLAGISETTANVDLLDKHALDETKRKLYKDLLLKNAKNWKSLWDVVKKYYIGKEDADAQKRGNLFQMAQKNFFDAIDLLEANELNQARNQLVSSSTALRALIAISPPSEQVQPPSEPEHVQQQSVQKKSEDKVLELLMEMDQEDAPSAVQQPLQKQEQWPW